MWKDHKTLRHIKESISGWSEGENPNYQPYYIRMNPEVEPENSIEYTTEKQPEADYPPEIFMTSAGKIDLHDEGEFGGYLAIGGKQVLDGNYSKIFEYCGEKYVIDDLKHMACATFRFARVNDNGTVDILYDAEQEEKIKYGEEERNRVSPEIGLESFCIGEGIEGEQVVYFLCKGTVYNFTKEDLERYNKKQYLLIYNVNNKEHPFIRIDLPTDKVEFSMVTSIWCDSMMLAIGCDKEVVMVYLPTMETEYWTGVDESEERAILKVKNRYKG